MLRRFDQFQFGPLNATRMNQLVDAVIALQRKVDDAPKFDQPKKDQVLVRITNGGTVMGNGSCAIGARAVMYGFTEISIGIGTCVEYEIPSGAVNSENSRLLVMEDSASLVEGDMVIAVRAQPTGAMSGASQSIYVAPSKSSRGASVDTAVVFGGDGGMYEGQLLSNGELVTIENMYETNGFYGAMDASVECARIFASSVRIPQNSIVWTFQPVIDGQPRKEWATMIPIAFDSVCTCNTDAIESQQAIENQAISDQHGKGGSAANIIARALGL